LTIITDSKYCVSGVESWLSNWKTNGWRNASGEPVANRDLWEIVDYLWIPNTKMIHVYGHGTCHGNIMADQFARDSLMKI
jgi:ribonuclease HI